MSDAPDEPTPDQLWDEAKQDLLDVIGDMLSLLRQTQPNVRPAAAAGTICTLVADELDKFSMQGGLGQQGLLMAYELRHVHPMTFMDLNRTKTELVKLSAARKVAIEARAKGKSSLLGPDGRKL